MVLLGLAGFALSALLYLFFGALLLTVKPQRMQQALLLAVGLSLLWAVLALLQLAWGTPLYLVMAAETLRNLGWFVLLLAATSPSLWVMRFNSYSSKRQRLVSIALLVALLQAFNLQLGSSGQWVWLVVQLAQSVVGLWLIEQLYRRVEPSIRSATKPLCLGLGLLFAFDFTLYAEAMLTARIPLAFWSLKGVIAMISVPLVLLSARRVKNWSTELYVSRDVVYHSTLLMVAGGYLLMMALVGYYIRYVGGAWGSWAQLAFFALSGLVLVSLFLSESFRKKVKVQITKHFFANKYEYRQEWMNFAAVLEEGSQSPYHVALQAINRPFGCSYTLLALKEQGEFRVVASYNTRQDDQEALRVLDAFAELALNQNWIIDLSELRSNHDLLPKSVSAKDLQSFEKFSLVVPIKTSAGFEGAFVLSPPSSTQRINWEDRDLLRAISYQLGLFLQMHHAHQALAESQQFDAFNRMSAFLVHDLKNVLAQLQLLSKNALKHRDNPEFIDDAFSTVDSAAQRLGKVVAHLSNQRHHQQALERVDLCELVKEVISRRESGVVSVSLACNPSALMPIECERERFSNVLSHLLQNAVDACLASDKSESRVVISVDAAEPGYFRLAITDNGIGMSEAFIAERLFKPFDTTKGNAGMGIGAYDAKRYVQELGGRLDVFSEEGEGSTFTLHLPQSNVDSERSVDSERPIAKEMRE
ncbi:XrtA/PEP-CTERM system histidine kinase PrsK [Aliagarivorans marinus]|uniref:XrtA/PEP-CTERM system histidine kinase PrsK n=1 Tax=Aliagarivorans marinus TaxID=561965 RepID=UPI000413F020|nr:XrtA/PEP-CTERM system histidine kinase PrsK [Aliagarivorans marinus]